MNMIAIDPGTHKSAILVYDGTRPYAPEINDNEEVLYDIDHYPDADMIAIEMIACYGMAVGAETFETCVWIGRFVERFRETHDGTISLVKRPEVKLHLCRHPRAKDANVRQALLDLYGGKEAAVGRKATPGPLYDIKSHLWAALGVAHTAWHRDVMGKEI